MGLGPMDTGACPWEGRVGRDFRGLFAQCLGPLCFCVVVV